MIPATRVFSFTVTIPAGTDPTAPITEDVSFPQASVVGIRWRVPPGPSGFMSFQITSDGAPVIPVQLGTYITADNEWETIEVSNYQDSGAWQVTGYNTDGYDHSVYVTFYTVEPGGDQTGNSQPGTATASIASNQLASPGPDTSGFVAGLQVQT